MSPSAAPNADDMGYEGAYGLEPIELLNSCTSIFGSDIASLPKNIEEIRSKNLLSILQNTNRYSISHSIDVYLGNTILERSAIAQIYAILFIQFSMKTDDLKLISESIQDDFEKIKDKRLYFAKRKEIVFNDLKVPFDDELLIFDNKHVYFNTNLTYEEMRNIFMSRIYSKMSHILYQFYHYVDNYNVLSQRVIAPYIYNVSDMQIAVSMHFYKTFFTMSPIEYKHGDKKYYTYTADISTRYDMIYANYPLCGSKLNFIRGLDITSNL
jgi:hypothetical protein